jgi:flagellar basal body-associated protein FliL
LTVDYAKKTPQPPVNRRRLWIVCLAILILVLSIPTLFYVHYLHMPHFHNKNIITKPILEGKKLSSTTQQQPQNNFDFYSMLPKMQVNVKKSAPSAVQIPQGKPYYLLQVATSTNQHAAQHLITELGVMGLNAFTKTSTNKEGKEQYQILVGPYLKDKNVSTDQAYLNTNHMNSIKLKITNSPKH